MVQVAGGLQDIDVGAMLTIPRVEPSPLSFKFRRVEGEPRLHAVQFGMKLCTESPDNSALRLAVPLPLESVIGSDSLEWA